MRLFLKDLSFSSFPREIAVPWSRPVWLKPFQLAIEVSITPRGLVRLPDNAIRLPALLDTGHNHNFSLREEHLAVSGLDFSELEWLGSPLRVRDASGAEHEVPRLLVDVWLHSNLPRLANRPFPFRLGSVGASCYLRQGAVSGPFLPLLGLRALCLATTSVELRCDPSGGRLNLRLPTLPKTE
jgi:hypothetical protein